MTDLIKRLRMLAPPNPVGRVVLTGDDWAEVSQIIADVERFEAFCKAACDVDQEFTERLIDAMPDNDEEPTTPAMIRAAFDSAMGAAAAKESGNAS